MKKTIIALALLSGTLFAAGYADGKAAFNAAKQLEKEKKPAEAIQAYQDAAKLFKKPGDQHSALSRAARLLCSQKKAADAVKLLLPFAENAKNPAPQRTMAYLDCARAVPADAAKYYDLGIALKAGDWTEGACWIGKAGLLLAQKKNAEAEAMYKQIAENVKYNEITRAVAYENMVKIALQKKDYAAAHACCASMYALGEKRYKMLQRDANMLNAGIFVAEKKFDDAVKLYTAIAGNAQYRPKDRVSAIESILVLEFETRNNPQGAQKALELFKANKLPMSAKAKKYEKEIRELTE